MPENQPPARSSFQRPTGRTGKRTFHLLKTSCIPSLFRTQMRWIIFRDRRNRPATVVAGQFRNGGDFPNSVYNLKIDGFPQSCPAICCSGTRRGSLPEPLIDCNMAIAPSKKVPLSLVSMSPHWLVAVRGDPCLYTVSAG